MYNTKGKTQKAYSKNKPTLNLVPKNCVCVFPIELVGGKTQVSNLGIMPNRRYYDKGSFLYWQEVFDGRSALKIQWEDSITLEQPEEGANYYLAKPSIGTYYYGKPVSSGSESLEISEDASFEEFMSMKATQTITLKFEYEPTNRESSKWELQKLFRFTLVDNDIYNLYLIPEICEQKLMYIADHQEYFDDLTGLAKGCEITFASLGDKIQKSGKAIEQYCSWNAPGEFSVRPEIYETDDGKEVGINPISLYYPTPIKYLQVEQQGPALTSTIYAIGRKQEWDEENACWKIGPSKILLPCEFITTQPNPLNRSATPTKNFFCFPDEQVTMVTNAEVLKWIQDNATQPLEQLKNAGMISIGDNWTSEGTDNNSNPIASGIRKDYFDISWQPLSYVEEAKEEILKHDTTGCVYSASEIAYSKTDTMIDIMCKNAFIFNQQPIIPLSFYSSRPLYLRNIPLIGAIANFFKLGDIKLKNNTTSRKCSNLCFFGDADVMTMCANLNGSFGTSFKEGSKVFPINFFGTNENMYQKLGVNSTNTTFCVALTDQVSINDKTWDTIYLGQSTYEDGSYLFETKQSLLANSTLKPIKPTTSDFIIDAVVVQSIFDGKIRLSCYGEEEQDFIYPQWTATILSNANWENGNMRDWTNIFLLSNWEERFCIQEYGFTWPEPPHKKDDNAFVLDTNASNSFSFEWNGSGVEYPTSNSWDSVWSNFTVQNNIATTQINKQLYSQTISWSDLGVETKAGFFDTYRYIQWSCDTSSGYWKTTQANVLGSQFTVTLDSSKTQYELECLLTTIRNNNGKWQIPISSGDDFNIRAIDSRGYVWPTQGDPIKGHFDQKMKVIISVIDTGVTVTIYDISKTITETSSGMDLGNFSGKRPINCGRGSGISHYPQKEKFGFNSIIKKILFKKA